MLIFLYGPDSYRRQRKLNKIIEEYKRKYSNLSCDYFDLENPEEFFRLKEFSAQLLIFDNKKLAVLKNIYETDSKKLKEFFKPYLDSEDFTILISEENSPPPEINFLKKKAFSVEKFENLEGDKWRFFIQKEARERNITFTPRALNFLAEIFKGDTWRLINELEKVSLFSPDPVNRDAIASVLTNLIIDVKDLEKIGDYHYESPDIFGYINAVCRDWSLSRRIIALEKLFIGQEEPVKIFNILASLKRLPTKLIQKLADYDIMVKSGKIDYEEVLLDLALSPVV
jgi:DNA polymerase III delta subunit